MHILVITDFKSLDFNAFYLVDNMIHLYRCIVSKKRIIFLYFNKRSSQYI